MNAEIIAVGSELLTPQRLDTNSLYVTAELNNLGVEVVAKSVVGDDRERLAEAVRRALLRSSIVVLSGGLGPTEDDVTREAVALAMDRRLVFRDEISEQIEARFRQLGRSMPEINKRQAYVLEGAEIVCHQLVALPERSQRFGEVRLVQSRRFHPGPLESDHRARISAGQHDPVPTQPVPVEHQTAATSMLMPSA
jgi:molybdenum cofactor synthesis domain-containing protein